MPIHGNIIQYDEKRHGLAMRLWQGCPTIAVTRGGRLFAGWYSGGSREPSIMNYNLLVESRDGGLSWSKPLFIIEGLPQENIQVLDIQLWMDPLERLWDCWVQRDWKIRLDKPDHLSTWAVLCEHPDAEKPSFSEPIYLVDGFLRCQPTALSDGRWLFCAYNWLHDSYAYYETADAGKSFQPCKAGKRLGKPNFDESMILERRDGSLWMLSRTVGIGQLAESVSTDGGHTWAGAFATTIPTPSTRFFLKRLKSGRVLLVNNHSSTVRNCMTAFLSEDDGKSWPYSLLLDPRETSYPDVAEDANGTLYIVWDRGRTTFKEILIARISEEDILAGKLVDYASYQGHLIAKAPTPYVNPDADAIKASDNLWLDEIQKTAYPKKLC